ncbi:MAG: hypothetical protein JWQ87_5416 [Candidatus Sulfotelmatobacter sp.]|nr:hypothetical protein [Candidatus Sulfotelmatobacter sp.]
MTVRSPLPRSTKAEINRALYGRKYSNIPTNGYASKREANVGAGLDILAGRNKIFDLQKQVRFVLVPAQKGVLRHERELAYVCDFTYRDAPDGKLHVVDAKGKQTQLYVVKRKLMKFFHQIEIEEL